MQLFLALFAVTFSLACAAQSGPNATKILSFSTWKSQQITAAENRTVRVANQITVMKSGHQDNQSDISKLTVEYRVSENAVQAVRDLTIEDYFNVYLSQFASDRSTIEAAARALTPEQVTALLKVYLSTRSSAEETADQAANP